MHTGSDDMCSQKLSTIIYHCIYIYIYVGGAGSPA